jgi:splicing factor, arginine/serine-rich 1
VCGPVASKFVPGRHLYCGVASGGNLECPLTEHPHTDLGTRGGAGKEPRAPAFAFLEFDDERDAQDAQRARNGCEFGGGRLRVEIAKGNFVSSTSRGPPRRSGFRARVLGLPEGASWQDVKDHMREAGDVGFASVERTSRGSEGVVPRPPRSPALISPVSAHSVRPIPPMAVCLQALSSTALRRTSTAPSASSTARSSSRGSQREPRCASRPTRAAAAGAGLTMAAARHLAARTATGEEATVVIAAAEAAAAMSALTAEAGAVTAPTAVVTAPTALTAVAIAPTAGVVAAPRSATARAHARAPPARRTPRAGRRCRLRGLTTTTAAPPATRRTPARLRRRSSSWQPPPILGSSGADNVEEESVSEALVDWALLRCPSPQRRFLSMLAVVAPSTSVLPCKVLLRRRKEILRLIQWEACERFRVPSTPNQIEE